MRLEQLEKAVPLTLGLMFAVPIGLRIAGVIPTILATGDNDIARSIFIDAGIGGLLAVLAIVISLTLMGIQFASQEYTHRVMNTYMKSFMLWSMIIIYLFTILYNLYMTAFIKVPINTIYADISVLLQSLCLIMLIPHFIFAVMHLRPDFIVDRILRSIDLEYILSIENFVSTGKGQVPTKIDRLLPAIEIIEKSIERGDRATVRMALDEIYVYYQRYVNPEIEDWAARYFLDYMLRVGRQAVIAADDDTIVQVLDILGNIGGSSSKENTIHSAIDNINTIGLSALKKDYDVAVEQMLDSLQQILSSEVSDKISSKIFDSFGELSEQLFSLDKKRLTRYLIISLSRLSEKMVEKHDMATVKKWSTVLEEIGRNVIVHRQRNAAHEAIEAFYHMGTLSAKSGWDVTRYIVEPLLRMEREINPSDRELIGETEYAKREIEDATRKYVTTADKETGIKTSDLW